jgi:DNA-directed RNA polymerase subunit beta'
MSKLVSKKVISESRAKINSSLLVYGKDGELIRSYNLPVGAHLMVENGEKIKAGIG